MKDVGSSSFDIEMLSNNNLDPWGLINYPNQLSKDGFLIFVEPRQWMME